jgi:hypothetical protein
LNVSTPRLIGQLIEKQIDGVRPAETFLLPPENGDPPRWQALVSSANAMRHASPRFCEGSRYCRRHDCDSKAVSDKLHGGLNIASFERCSALDVTLRKYFIDEPSEGAVGRQIDEDLLGKRLERHQAARCQWVIARADRDERIMHIGNDLDAGPSVSADDRMEAEVDLAGSDETWNCVGDQGAYGYIDRWKNRAKLLQEWDQLKIRAEALQDAKAQLPANDSVPGPNCLHGSMEGSECRTSMLQEQHTRLSKGDLARGAFDEHGPKFFFQFFDRV